MSEHSTSGPDFTSDAAHRAAHVKVAAGGFLSRFMDRLQGIVFGTGPKWVASHFAPRWKYGTLAVTWPDGEIMTLEGAEDGPQAQLTVHDWKMARRLLTGGGVGFARSYIAGEWTTPALDKVIEVAALNRNHVGDGFRGRGWVKMLDRARHMVRANTKEKARQNIAFHYDLGNDFYSQWLDDTMTYSSALFETPDTSLADAQVAKYRRLLEQLNVQPGQHILEIGCGWGGLAEVAARDYGARVTGVTLSEEQLAYAQNRMERLGLSDKAKFQLRDYRDVTETYDHIVSIEMFEAVGEAYWPTYFDKVRSCLKPGGKAALQIITIEDAAFDIYRKGSDFIQTYIFPGGMLPSPKVLRGLVADGGLTMEDEFSMGQDYAITCHRWRDRFEAAWTDGRIPPGFDDGFRRIWEYYLAYCEGGFRAGGIDVLQVCLVRPS